MANEIRKEGYEQSKGHWKAKTSEEVGLSSCVIVMVPAEDLSLGLATGFRPSMIQFFHAIARNCLQKTMNEEMDIAV